MVAVVAENMACQSALAMVFSRLRKVPLYEYFGGYNISYSHSSHFFMVATLPKQLKTCSSNPSRVQMPNCYNE